MSVCYTLSYLRSRHAPRPHLRSWRGSRHHRVRHQDQGFHGQRYQLRLGTGAGCCWWWTGHHRWRRLLRVRILPGEVRMGCSWVYTVREPTARVICGASPILFRCVSVCLSLFLLYVCMFILHTLTHARTYTSARAQKHTHTHTHTRTHRHTHTHTHTPPPPPQPPPSLASAYECPDSS